MRYGIKLWSTNDDLYEEAVKFYKQRKFDYLELTYVPNNASRINVLVEEGIPVVVHAPTLNQNICFSDGDFNKNKKILKDTLEFADKLNSEGIIIHPSFGKKENFLRFLKGDHDSEIIIENMPKTGFSNRLAIGYTAEQIKEFLDSGPFNFCLDFAHAIKAAVSQGSDYKKYVKEFIKLNPLMFHISDGNLDSEKDEHLSLGEGEFDLKFIKNLIKDSNNKITFEVPKKDGLKNDLKSIDFFKGL